MVISKNISEKTYRRLCVQGYGSFSDTELAALRFGIRFPYALCAIIAAIGIISVNIPIIAVIMIIAVLGVIFPYHPFDYLYNYGLRQLLNRPKLPPRTAQAKFACGIATAWLAVTIVLFWYGLTIIGMVWGGVLVAIATLVSTTDICIPSIIYNWITRQKI